MTQPSAGPINPEMDEGVFLATAVVTFGSLAEAERRVAGVAAAGRIVRELSQAGFAVAWLAIPAGPGIGPAAIDDIRRLAGAMTVHIGEPEAGTEVAHFPGSRLFLSEAIIAGQTGTGSDLADPRTAADILRRTGKSGDGMVSRLLNRPISRSITSALLRIPAVRPLHATVGTGLLALMMFAALLAEARWSLAVGALLFQAASIFDGVDGEIARATFRSSRWGATLDTAIDAATNVLFIGGLAFNLWRSGHEQAAMLGGGGLAILVAGMAMIGTQSVRAGHGFRLELVKDHYRASPSGAPVRRLLAFLTIVSSRDFFALLFALLVLFGWPMVVLYLFSAATVVWIVFVLASMIAAAKLSRGESTS